METAAVITPRTTQFIRKREKTPENKPLSRSEAQILGDLHAISLIEEALKCKERVSREDIFKILDR